MFAWEKSRIEWEFMLLAVDDEKPVNNLFAESGSGTFESQSEEPMAPTLGTQYEVIGNRISQYAKSLPATEAQLKEQLSSFLKKYAKAPLFIVGIDDSVYAEWLKHPSDEAVAEFHLPFPTMVLDFPNGLLQKSDNPKMGDSIIIFIDTIAKNTYLFEGLRTDEAFRRALDAAPANEKGLITSVGFPRPAGDVGEAFSFVVGMVPEENGFSANYSCEFIYDCQVPVTPLLGITSYAAFTRCQPLGGKCMIKTPLCRMLDGTTNFTVIFIMMVISYINRQDRFILTVTPEMTDHEKRLAVKGKKLSFAKKPAHIVLDHSQVREIIAAAKQGGTHASPLPHQRRGHWRQLQADCYKEKRKVWVRPADINKGMSVKIQKNVYEVVS